MNDIQEGDFIRRHNDYLMTALTTAVIPAVWLDHGGMVRHLQPQADFSPVMGIQMDRVTIGIYPAISYKFCIYSLTQEGANELMLKFCEVACKLTKNPQVMFRKTTGFWTKHGKLAHHWKARMNVSMEV